MIKLIEDKQETPNIAIGNLVSVSDCGVYLVIKTDPILQESNLVQLLNPIGDEEIKLIYNLPNRFIKISNAKLTIANTIT